MSIEQQLAALIAALQENTAAQLGNVPAILQVQNPVETPPAPAVAPTPVTQAPTPAAPPVQEQMTPVATPDGTAPATATTPIAAAPATPGVAAQPAVVSPSDLPGQVVAAGAAAEAAIAGQPAYGLNELRAEVLAKYNATNKSTAVTDLVQRYGGGNVSAIVVEQYGNFLGELRAIA